MNKLPVKQIQYGAFVLDVACDADQNTFMTQRSLEKLVGWRANQARKKLASKSIETALGDTLRLGKLDIQIGRIDTNSGQSKANNQKLIPLDLAIALIGYAAIKEQLPKAQAIMLSGFSTDIKNTILRGFGHEIAIDSLRLQEQFKGLRTFQFREWTDVIRDRHIELFGCKPTNEYYRDCIVMVNLALFDVHNFKKNRDNMDTDQQELIRDFEKMLVRQAKKYPDYDPKELITLTLPTF